MKNRAFVDFALAMTLLAVIFTALMFYSKSQQTHKKVDSISGQMKYHLEDKDIQSALWKIYSVLRRHTPLSLR